MVFKKEAPPKTRVDFMKWYFTQIEWEEDHSYDDPANTSVELSNWFMEMIKTFPAMNGPFASTISDDDHNDLISDYSIGRDVIYVAFSWSVAEQAYTTILKLAKKHKVGFFEVSSDDGDILFPENGELISINNLKGDFGTPNVKNIKKQWWKFW